MRYCSFDIETTGFNPFKDKIFSYCIGDYDGNVEVYRLDGKSYERIKNGERLCNFILDTSIAKVCHNYHFELSFLKEANLIIPEETVWHDTMLMSQLLRNLAPSHALDALCWELGGYTRKWDIKVKTMGKALGGYQHIPESIMNSYQKADGERTMLLFQLWHDELKADKKLYDDYLNEIALVKVTQRLEAHGIMLDRKEAEKLINWLEEELLVIRNATHYYFGEFYNWSSSTQVKKVLYKDMGLPVMDLTEKGEDSTGKAVLMSLREKYDNPVFNLILKHRSYIKGLAMIKGYVEHADENDIIHAKLNTNQARTGRESSSNPNLQNIAKSEVLLNPFPVPARKCFRIFPGHVLLFGDYAGIEMRLIIDASGDMDMLEAVKNGDDVHRIAAEILYGSLWNGEKVKRNAAKNAHFAIPYGAGLSAVAHSLGLTMEKARPGLERYRELHPLIAFFSSEIANQVKEVGYVITPFGRKLYIPDDKAYSGANYLIQGTAAGIIKRAQNKVDKYLKDKWDDDIRLVVPVHDELVISYPRQLLKYVRDVQKGINKQMIDIPEIKVPLEIEWAISTTTWENAKEVKV